jgi:hypothetical protein
MTRRWSDPNGIPTKHAIEAAVRVAALIDPGGSPVRDARETYWHVPTGATIPPVDLAMGEALLVDLGLATVIGGVLRRTEQLEALLAGDEDLLVGSMLVSATQLLDRPVSPEVQAAFGSRATETVRDPQHRDATIAVSMSLFDAARRILVGEIGEEHVVREAQRELVDAGHERLAMSVRHVSRISDAYGYDITAPRINGPARLLEVKSTTDVGDGEVKVFISRHEADVGAQHDEWAMVVCHVQDLDQRIARTVGWLRYQHIQPRLPTNLPGSRWESASLSIPLDLLSEGIPSAFL